MSQTNDHFKTYYKENPYVQFSMQVARKPINLKQIRTETKFFNKNQ